MLTIRRYLVLFAMTFLVMGVFVPALTHADNFPAAIVPSECGGKDAATACTVCSLTKLARNLLNFAIFLAIVMSAVLFSWAGIRYMTAQGDIGVSKAAKQTLLNVFFGLLLILSAWLIINTLMSLMVNQSFSGALPWTSLCTS